jgi:hypothetical protein
MMMTRDAIPSTMTTSEVMVAGFVAVVAIPALLVGSLVFADKLASKRYRFRWACC